MNTTLTQPGLGNGGSMPRLVVRQPCTGGNSKLIRLRCHFRPLQDTYIVNDEIAENDSDVVFLCSDGEVRAHKIILASSSQFFASLFDGQFPGIMTSVLIPDIPVVTVRIILSLAYKDNANLTTQQMKDASPYLKLFGFPPKLFNYDGNPLHQPASAIPRTVPIPINTEVGGSCGNVRIVNQNQGGGGGGMSLGPNRSIGPSGSITVTPSSTYREVKAQQLPAAQQRKRTNKEEFGYEQKSLLRTKILQQQQRVCNPQIRTSLADESTLKQCPSFNFPEGRLTQEWMRNVDGGESSQRCDQSSSAGNIESVQNQCRICSIIFDSEEKAKWHIARHIGLELFKCQYCNELFSTPPKVYIHEMIKHGESNSTSATIASDFQIAQGRKRRGVNDYEIVNQLGTEGDSTSKMRRIPTTYGSHSRRLPGTARHLVSQTNKHLVTASHPQLQQKYASLNNNNFKAQHPLIGIAKTEAEGLVEWQKVKHLHWIYVCFNCDYASDTLAKAHEHYTNCRKVIQGTAFESSVVKYKQGFFGKYKCPLCPKRYTSVSGFAIHCGRFHNDYGKRFAHRQGDGGIRCILCEKKYEDPAEFHAHLSDDAGCTGVPVAVFGPDDSIGNKRIGNETPGESYLRTLSRLANRMLTVAHNETAFNPINCPLCGANQIANIVYHLRNEHADLNIQVLRIADTTLRCQKCSHSFALCDLSAHHSSCAGSRDFQFGSARPSATNDLLGSLSTLTKN